MGLLVSMFLSRRVFIVINAHEFITDHTLIRASGESNREERRRTERTGCTQHGNTGLQTIYGVM